MAIEFLGIVELGGGSAAAKVLHTGTNIALTFDRSGEVVDRCKHGEREYNTRDCYPVDEVYWPMREKAMAQLRRHRRRNPPGQRTMLL